MKVLTKIRWAMRLKPNIAVTKEHCICQERSSSIIKKSLPNKNQTFPILIQAELRMNFQGALDDFHK